MTAIFSYVVVHDMGFAPNPFGGLLTLATCKPRIRQVAEVGDWLVGTGSVRGVGVGRLIYAAEVSEVIPLDRYGTDPRFEFKRPYLSENNWKRHGDNIYYQTQNKAWVQRRNLYHGAADVARDTSAQRVLVCEKFWYFGRCAPELPVSLKDLAKQQPGHRRSNDQGVMVALQQWLQSFSVGINGEPYGSQMGDQRVNYANKPMCAKISVRPRC